MFHRLCFLFACGLFILACSEPEACEEEGFGHINFNNLSDRNVEVTLNGSSIGEVEANSMLRHKFTSGQIEIMGEEDRLLFAKTWEDSVFLETCEELEHEFRP